MSAVRQGPSEKNFRSDTELDTSAGPLSAAFPVTFVTLIRAVDGGILAVILPPVLADFMFRL